MRKNKINKYFPIIAFVFLIIYGCFTSPTGTGDTYKYDFSSIYNPGQSSLHPQCFVYHHNEETSLLFFKQNSSELFFDIDKSGIKSANLLVKYTLRVQSTNELTDSLSTSYKIDLNENGNDIVSYIEIKAEAGKKYDLVVLIADANKKKYRRLLIEVDKTKGFDFQNFFVEKLGNKNTPVFNRIVYKNNLYRINENRFAKSEFTLEYYSPINEFAEPPHVIKPNRNIHNPDTTYYYLQNDTIEFSKKGIYLFKLSDEVINGLSLLNFGEYFPKVRTPEQMIGPLRYLTTERQVEKIVFSENKKLAIEEFWISVAGDAVRAKELIRIYYNRVQLANKFFTSHLEGWQTDRGMVYIILGPPNIIYKNSGNEEWVYGENPSITSLDFLFEKRVNIFSNNDFYLVRDAKYQTMWAQAIETWRKGRAFSMTTK